jgi:hypothetical protein
MLEPMQTLTGGNREKTEKLLAERWGQKDKTGGKAKEAPHESSSAREETASSPLPSPEKYGKNFWFLHRNQEGLEVKVELGSR